MFDRLRICILHPRFIGKFIIEKMYKIWILYVILFLLMGILIFFLVRSSAYLTSSEVNYLVTEMAKNEEINLEYSNNTLSGSPKTFTISSVTSVSSSLISSSPNTSSYKISKSVIIKPLFFKNY